MRGCVRRATPSTAGRGVGEGQACLGGRRGQRRKAAPARRRRWAHRGRMGPRLEDRSLPAETKRGSCAVRRPGENLHKIANTKRGLPKGVTQEEERILDPNVTNLTKIANTTKRRGVSRLFLLSGRAHACDTVFLPLELSTLPTRLNTATLVRPYYYFLQRRERCAGPAAASGDGVRLPLA